MFTSVEETILRCMWSFYTCNRPMKDFFVSDNVPESVVFEFMRRVEEHGGRTLYDVVNKSEYDGRNVLYAHPECEKGYVVHIEKDATRAPRDFSVQPEDLLQFISKYLCSVDFNKVRPKVVLGLKHISDDGCIQKIVTKLNAFAFQTQVVKVGENTETNCLFVNCLESDSYHLVITEVYPKSCRVNLPPEPISSKSVPKSVQCDSVTQEDEIVKFLQRFTSSENIRNETVQYLHRVTGVSEDIIRQNFDKCHNFNQTLKWLTNDIDIIISNYENVTYPEAVQAYNLKRGDVFEATILFMDIGRRKYKSTKT